MANDKYLSSVTYYNVTMLNTNYYNDFFELGQQKINFSFFELHLSDDDDVYTDWVRGIATTDWLSFVEIKNSIRLLLQIRTR